MYYASRASDCGGHASLLVHRLQGRESDREKNGHRDNGPALTTGQGRDFPIDHRADDGGKLPSDGKKPEELRLPAWRGESAKQCAAGRLIGSQHSARKEADHVELSMGLHERGSTG